MASLRSIVFFFKETIRNINIITNTFIDIPIEMCSFYKEKKRKKVFFFYKCSFYFISKRVLKEKKSDINISNNNGCGRVLVWKVLKNTVQRSLFFQSRFFICL